MFPAVDEAGRYAPCLAAIRGRAVSGVYVILDPGGAVLYVGESHTGRLYDTITRHFRRWSIDPATDATGRRRGGTTYDRRRVLLIVDVLPAGDAQRVQYDLIRRMQPRDNGTDCRTCPI